MGAVILGWRAERNIAWIEAWCRIPAGRNRGQPFILEPFERDIVAQIYTDPPARIVVITMPKKNGKTTFAATLLLLHLIGPESVGRDNGELYSSAMSRKQAGRIFKAASQMIELNPHLDAKLSIVKNQWKIEDRSRNIEFAALAREAGVNQGVSSFFTIHDELGEVRKPTDRQFSYLHNGMGAWDHPTEVIISTQAEEKDHLLSLEIEKARRDPARVLIMYQCPEDHPDIFSDEALAEANPGAGSILSWDDLRSAAMSAKIMPSEEPEYRRLRLNQQVRIGTTAWLKEKVWMATQSDSVFLDEFEGKRCWGGLDLSQTHDPSSLALVFKDGPDDYRAFVWTWIVADRVQSLERESGAPIERWVNEGYLETVDDAAIDYEVIVDRLSRVVDRFDLVELAYDPWDITKFRRALEKHEGVDVELRPHAQQFGKFGEDSLWMPDSVVTTENAILRQRLLTERNPWVTWCVSNCVAVRKRDNPKLRKLAKEQPYLCIDPAIALVMAVGAASPYAHEEGIDLLSIYENWYSGRRGEAPQVA